MANTAVRGFYLITQTIKDQLLLDENVNTVTTGDLTEIDLSKQTIFPLSHVIINSATIQEQVIRFNITVLAMDIVDFSKEEIDELMKKMQSGDYENLVKVFDEEFGYFVVLER